MMPSRDEGEDLGYEVFAETVESETLKRIAWQWYDARGDRKIPGWSDVRVRLAEIQKLLPIIWVYSYDQKKELFTGRFAGVNIEQIFGMSFIGTPMEELYPPKAYPRLYERAKRVVCTPELYRGVGMVFSHLDHSGAGERIMLPLSDDGVYGDGVLGATVYQFFLGERIDPTVETDAWFPL